VFSFLGLARAIVNLKYRARRLEDVFFAARLAITKTEKMNLENRIGKRRCHYHNLVSNMNKGSY